MRCPDCCRFVSLDTQDPEVESLEADGDRIIATVRITRVCADCGTELKEATIELEHALPDLFVEEHADHDLDVDGDVELTEQAGGRYAKSYIGARLAFRVYFNGGEVYANEMESSVAASEFEEIV
jgi:hypothetical protein